MIYNEHQIKISESEGIVVNVDKIPVYPIFSKVFKRHKNNIPERHMIAYFYLYYNLNNCKIIMPYYPQFADFLQL